jgi:predicted dinucleotide-binding enzyme
MKKLTFGFIGTGHIGGAVAKVLARAGHDVVLSNSRGPASLADAVKDIGPRAKAAPSTADAAKAGDIVVVAVPIRAMMDLPEEAMAGKIVIGTTNYIPQYDGHIGDLDSGSTTTAQMLQKQLPKSRVVKAFSHISAAEVLTDGAPQGSPGRRALALVGDDAEAKRAVAGLYEELGFDAIDAGGLAESWRFEFGQPSFAVRQNAAQLRENLARASRGQK